MNWFWKKNIWGVIAMFLACTPGEENALQKAMQSIQEEELVRHIQVLASDEFKGRLPASEGEEKTLAYLTDQFRQLELQPGNGDSFLQKVPLVEITGRAIDPMQIQVNRRRRVLTPGREYVAVTRRMQSEVLLEDSPLIFAGYGIVAPEYQWNDYAGLDVRGKTVLVLVNDPGYATGDSSLFTGKAMTYYGRWTYKYEEAARQGAAGVIIIHQTGPAGYPWNVVQNSWSGRQFYLEAADGNRSRCLIEGWITESVARWLFQQAGLDFDRLARAAARRGFRGRELPATVRVHLSNELRRFTSYNVLALLPGSQAPEELIVYTAHWDHLGELPGQEGRDHIFNGARDNASGTAALLAIARAFRQLPEPPRRSILFLAVTAEEQGLLGSAYYATHPVYPLNKTVAVLNMDALNIFGPMKDIRVVGYGLSELDEYLREVASVFGREVKPDPEPEKGGFFRSDHFSFAKQGVPALNVRTGIEHREYGREWTLKQIETWTREHYHKPSDEFDPRSWDMRGMVEDVRLLFLLGYRLAQEDRFPNWREGTEFRAAREAMMGRQ